jgi:hypothetical protein
MIGLPQAEYNDRRTLELALNLINISIDQTKNGMAEATGKRARKMGRYLGVLLVRKTRLLDEYSRFQRA